jgi:pimeloyl-ACP methyl ester carboxylesterase
VVLGGHSWSGTLVSEVGGDDGISALVYIAARAPDAGEDFPALAKQYPTPPASAGIVVAPDGYAQLAEDTFLSDFAGGVPTARARALYAVQGRNLATLPTERTTAAGWHDKPSWYQVSTQDRTINPDLERFLAQRMGAHTIELDSSHLSLVTHPKPVADLILAAAGVA